MQRMEIVCLKCNNNKKGERSNCKSIESIMLCASDRRYTLTIIWNKIRKPTDETAIKYEQFQCFPGK